jgi:hypothetical protein
MKARYCDLVATRFLPTDPIRYQDQINLYAYVGNHPVSGCNQLGMCDCNVGPSKCTTYSIRPEMSKVLDRLNKECAGKDRVDSASLLLVQGGGVSNLPKTEFVQPTDTDLPFGMSGHEAYELDLKN